MEQTFLSRHWSVPHLPVVHGRLENCLNCPRKRLCLADKLGQNHLPDFSDKISRSRPVKSGQKVISAGEAFNGIFIVKSGFFKSSCINSGGELQVTRFHLPGEIFGLEGLVTRRYDQSVEALETGTVCRIPFSVFESNTEHSSTLMRALISVMSEMMTHDNELIFALAKMNAARRLATFLIDLSIRLQRAGFSEKDMTLSMKRTDIGNYLGLAEETVCRLFTKFQLQGLLVMNRRYIKSYNLEKLRMMAHDDVSCDVTVIPRTLAKKPAKSLVH